MHTTDRTRPQHRPATRPEPAADHPAGEIRLTLGAGLGRRAELLSGQSLSLNDTTAPFTTQTLPF
ncbi:hypothetical protein [Kitasatospora sp. NPDC085879]|uniref:hypothetical protein n=1 Tax=Kitasatospora sp. NPDC085879 TaxID=3154769 RepID=UPI00342D74D2